MGLPAFNNAGDLPPGVHRAAIEEVEACFGGVTPRRRLATSSLKRIHALCKQSGVVTNLLVFGSYVTTERDPNDVDIVLLVSENLDIGSCPDEFRTLLDHQRAEAEFGSSVFWLRPSRLSPETFEALMAQWQMKRDGSRRGVVEVIL